MQSDRPVFQQKSYQSEILELVKLRKNQMKMIVESMQNDDVYFLKCFRIAEQLTHQVSFGDKYYIFLRNLLVFTQYLTPYIETQNSIDKLLGFLKLSEEYEYLYNSEMPFEAKKKVSELPTLAFIVDDQNLNKKGKNRIMVCEAKNMQMLEQMNFQAVIESFCMVLELIYTTFADSVYNQKEAFEIINKIDQILYSKFFDFVIELFLNTSENVLKDEFAKINSIVFEKENYFEHTQLDDMIQLFDNML